MKAGAAALAFVAASVTTAMVLAFQFGGISQSLALVSFSVGLLAAVVAWRAMPGSSERPNAWDVLMLAVFALASLRAFLWVIYPVGDEWKILSPNNLGDISLHIHLIRYLASGVAFWPESPILAGTPLVYPAGADLFNSLLLTVGVPVEKGLVWVGLGGAMLTAWSLWRWGRAFALAAFLFSGGLAGFMVFQSGRIADFQGDLAWKNLFLALFVTQRGLLYALPAGLFLLTVWREEFFRARPGAPFWLSLLLYASMPLFNVHAFLFLSIVLALAFVVCPGARRTLGVLVACAVVPASLAVCFVTGGFFAASGIRWLPGWMQGDKGVQFWFWNFGVALPLLALLAWRTLRRRNPEDLCFVGAGILVFVVCCFVSFATWEWDNTKLFLWAWLVCAPFLWDMILPWKAPVRVAVCVLLFFSGAVSLCGGLDGRHGYRLASRSELARAAVEFRKLPPGARVAIEPDYNNPAILLGHPVLCGYEGHLVSHGLRYRRQWDALQDALARRPGWELGLSNYCVDWVFRKGPPPVLTRVGD